MCRITHPVKQISPISILRNCEQHQIQRVGLGNNIDIWTFTQIRPQKASFVQRDISAFDARFFGITEDEALATDPQLRILLETTYRALENGMHAVSKPMIFIADMHISTAGIPMHAISGTDASVYTGCFTAVYMLATSRDPDNAPRYAATGMAQSMLSNRISSCFNVTGPSVTLDTACSSSLVALDMACRSIRQGESSLVCTVPYSVSTR